jgi:hypothetical protein
MTSPATRNREIRLRSRPIGLPRNENFEVAETPIPEPGPGQILVRNLWMSVDPYMRPRMFDRKSYIPPFQIGQPLEGGAIGRVVASDDPKFAPGDLVSHFLGWREYALVPAKGAQKLEPASAPVQSYLGALGMPGMTAYVGLFRIGELKEGETVFVSAAAGAVGAIACQIAKIKGCRVIGSAGSEDKVRWLKDEIGVDTTINYKKAGDLTAALQESAPDGIDLYFDNVGGSHLEAAFSVLKPFGRVVLCGMISQYNEMEPQPGPRNMFTTIQKRLTLKGFIVSDHLDMQPQFLRDMGEWIGQGRLHWQETVEEGIENAPKALMALFTGENLGKMLVRLAPEGEARA